MEPREFTNSKITVPDDIWNAVASVVPRLSRVEAVIRINRLLGPNARGIGISWYKKELARRKREAAENALTLPLAADDAAGDGASTTDTNLARLDDAAQSVGEPSAYLDAAAQTDVAASPTSPSASRTAEFHDPMPESHSHVRFADDGAPHAADDAQAQPTDAAEIARACFAGRTQSHDTKLAL
jgi:hypothetical protein